ncbi:MAG: biopolymer transporter ExbD [Candidatus Brocadiae bacterium]|nr:biopolymer transporter ExbD [Candidatus Brocadiia bacterium]
MKKKKQNQDVGLQSAMMTDLVFTLFIFFILVSTIKKDAMEIKAPKVQKQSTSSSSKSQHKFTITLDKKDEIYVDGKKVDSQSLLAVFQEIKKKLPPDAAVSITLRADSDSKTSKLLEVWSVLNGAGLGESQLECEVESK